MYATPNIFRVIKLMRMRWAEHVTRIGHEGKGNGKVHLKTGHEGSERE